MTRRAVVLAIAASIAWAAGCGAGTKAPTCAVAQPIATGVPFLWKATRDGAGTLWLLGTVHNAPKDAVPGAAWDALAGATRFVSELGDLEPDPDKLREVTQLPRGQGLPELLGTDDWYELRDALRGVVDEDTLKRLRPWIVISHLSKKMAPLPAPVMDDAVMIEAQGKHLPIEHLEEWDQQLASLVDAVSVDDLREAIHLRGSMKCDSDQIVAAYRSGDLAAIAPLITARDAEHMVWQRNRRWVPELEAFAAGGGAFVVVGLGHMLGDQGLPALLAAAGYTVERVGAAVSSP